MNKKPDKNIDKGFTLLEILVALSILSIMVVFMFTLIDATTRLWRVGSKQMEAARAANIGLNLVFEDLSKAVCGNYSIQYSNPVDGELVAGSVVIPFETILTPANTLNLGGGAINAEGSQMLRAVVSTDDGSFKEIGLMCVFMSDEDGYDSMEGGKYYLVYKNLPTVEAASELNERYNELGDYFDYGTFNVNGMESWPYNNGTTNQFLPIVDNCIRLKFEYAIKRFSKMEYVNPSSGGTTNWSWLNVPYEGGNYISYINNWPHRNTFEFPFKRMRDLDSDIGTYDRLCGILITATIIDPETAEKISAMKDGSALTLAEIDEIISGDGDSDFANLFKSAPVTLRRFIPIHPPQY